MSAMPQQGTTGPTEYAVESYTPKPKTERKGIGLCLSGGGYRATLFHLGALRRLNELDILGRVRTISSVSGGSITAAFLATNVPWPLNVPRIDWEGRVAKPLRAFTAKNIRTAPILKRLLPWNWLKESTGVEALAERYEQELTPLKLRELPDKPNFVLCATDMAFGDNWVFENTRMGAYQPGYIVPPPEDWPLARAVAASACFPPVFNPLPVRFPPGEFVGGKAAEGPKRDAAIADLRLTDGGNYDNLGLEPVWKDHEFVLVSDGGGMFDFEADKNLIWRIQRYTAIVANQARALRKRWLISSFLAGMMEGTYWGIGSARTNYDPQDTLGYSKELAREVIAEIRTDLDAFSEPEAAVLENHGYLLADVAIRKHAAHLLPSPVPPLSIPHEEWQSEPKVREALANSRKRKFFGRW